MLVLLYIWNPSDSMWASPDIYRHWKWCWIRCTRVFIEIEIEGQAKYMQAEAYWKWAQFIHVLGIISMNIVFVFVFLFAFAFVFVFIFVFIFVQSSIYSCWRGLSAWILWTKGSALQICSLRLINSHLMDFQTNLLIKLNIYYRF